MVPTVWATCRVAPTDQSRKPALCMADFALGHANHRPGSVNQHHAQIGFLYRSISTAKI
jgi:hypothetical protein